MRNFEESVDLLNWGLENRVMGCTKMNATSSRSHTVLTLRVTLLTPPLSHCLDVLTAAMPACSPDQTTWIRFWCRVNTSRQAHLCGPCRQ